MKGVSLLHSSPSILGLVYVCKVARLDTTFTELYKKSNIKFKKSFLSYLKFCKDNNLIVRIGISHTGLRGQRKSPIYRTTDEGHQFLTLLNKNN